MNPEWPGSHSKISLRGAALLESSKWSDCAFLVGSEPNQVTFNAHKLILAMASPVFEAMFYGGMAQRGEPIQIMDVQPDAFKALLEYIYADEVNISSFDKACELCYAAKKYMLPHLVQESTNRLWRDLHAKNVCRAYEFANLFDETLLMDKCMQMISSQTKAIISEPNFIDLEPSTVITIFSLDCLNIDSELDLFKAALQYAKAPSRPQSESRSLSASLKDLNSLPLSSSREATPIHDVNLIQNEIKANSVDSCSNDENMNISIKNIVKQIRFLTLTAQQFAEGPARSTLLSESESYAILINILLSAASDVPMPEGFSTSRTHRMRPGSAPLEVVDTPIPVMLVDACSGTTIRSLQHDFTPNTSCSNSSSVPLAPSLSGLSERRRSDLSRRYCLRAIIQQTECFNNSVLDCTINFTVDRNICVLGIQVPTQVQISDTPSAGPSHYSELLYAHLLDSDEARLTYTHYTSRVPYGTLLDIIFNRPIILQRDKIYKVGVVLNKAGWYPMGRCGHQVGVDTVLFNFSGGTGVGGGQLSDCVREGLIRSIIFTY